MSTQLPNGWAWATPTILASPDKNSLCIGPFGSNLKVSDYCVEGVPLVFVRNIRSEVFAGYDLKYVSTGKAAQLAAHVVKPGDVLITKMGEPPGDSALYPLSRPVGIITADCIRWSVDPRIVSARYVVYATRSTEVREQILGIAKGVAQRKVSLARFKSVRYRLAPPAEQHRIVEAIDSYLTRLDDAMVTLARVQRNLKRYRASVLRAAVEGRLVPTEAELARAEGREYEPAWVLLERILEERRRRWEEAELAKMGAKGKLPKNSTWKAKYVEPAGPDSNELPELPEGWCWTTVDQLIADPLANGRSVKTADTGFPVLRLTSLKNGRVDLEEHKIGAWTAEEASGFLIQEGDFLVARGNGSIRLVGAGGIVSRVSIPMAYPDTIIRMRLSLFVDPIFFAHVWNSRSMRDQIESKAKTTAGIFKVNQKDLSSCLIPLPPAQEQFRIQAEIQRVFGECDASQDYVGKSVIRCSHLRQSILKWAFEGRLADQDPSDEPADVLLERIRAERAAGNSKKQPRTRRVNTRSASA